MSRAYCAINPVYSSVVSDAEKLVDAAPALHHRLAARDEVRDAKANGCEIPRYILVFDLERWTQVTGVEVAGVVRLGWRWPMVPTVQEIATYQFETGNGKLAAIPAILRGAATAIKAQQRKRGAN